MEGTRDSSTKYGPTKTRRPTYHRQYHQPNTSNTALMNLCDQYGPHRHHDFLCYCCCCCRHRQDHPALLPLPSPPPPLLLMPLHLLPPPLLPRNNNNHHHSINNGSNHHYPKKPSWKQQKPSRSPSSVEEAKTNSATTKVIDTHPTKVSPLIKHEHPSLTRRLAHTEPLVVARRPDLGGREGTTIALLANHFKVGFDPSQRIFLYDVDITPRPSKEVARMIKSRLVQDNSSILSESLPVYDGRRSLYSPVKFQHDRLEFYVSLPLRNDSVCQLKNDNSKLFRVNIRLASKLDGCELARYLRDEEEQEAGEDGIVPLPQDYLQALDIALRESPGEKCIRMGRCLYSNDSGTDIGGGAVGLRGFFQSLRPTQQGLTLNVDFSVMAFHESIGVIPYLQKRLDFLRDLPQKKWRALTEDERREVERALKNMRVFVCHRDTDQRYRVYGLTEEATEDLRFRDRNGGELRVVDYFKDNYNHDIQFRNLPCLQIGGSKPCYLPMELCMVCEGQKFLGKLSDNQTTRIIKMGCQKPGERRAIINRVMGGAISPASSCYASQFNLKVSKEMTRLTGRVLQPPRLKFGDNGHVRDLIPTRHDRQWSLLDCHVAEGIRINRWALISFGGTPEQRSCVPRFIKQLCHRCNLLGIHLSKNTIVAPQFESMQALNSVSALEKKLRKIHEAASNELQLLICVMERKHKGYADLKRIAETSIGVLSQCCLYQNLSKLGSQFLVNLALKINAKAGGRNVALYNSFSRQVPRLLADDEPVIFMGADVTHPHPLDDVSPSIAAVVGSMDWPAVNRYVSRMRSQTHRQEIIQDLTEMVEELLNEFQQCVKKLPKRILFFRDGVSETQFHKVLDKELKAIQAACSRFQQPYRPAITFAVVQKRHHTRLFLDESSEPGSSADENVPAGTVVDTVITHPREFDFYLCTHWGTKGTSRPTHYHVLWDDSRFTSDELQRLIHSLCYTFVRCTKPVSLVPPAYYAHLAAYRGRLYLDRPELIGRTTYSRAAPPSQATPLPKLSDKIKKLMFYC
ncbi:Protein argonaute 7 [Acorus calamus]|uniref:Protein argonaute 7 n=1 Tax=Acorus calamus TaxID=4465 RepID=A0AAV9ETW0_ACOCL|nr:Protein argonaute 7 [Acorus calamus]